ncbi:hypothetical protein T484DRAFT_3133372 [Baffinella frigidus]|nr:hypothetical protein T484DRAFT_3133372 [Cryptophyta sp. CCMP2293]
MSENTVRYLPLVHATTQHRASRQNLPATREPPPPCHSVSRVSITEPASEPASHPRGTCMSKNTV